MILMLSCSGKERGVDRIKIRVKGEFKFDSKKFLKFLDGDSGVYPSVSRSSLGSFLEND